jgi:UDP-N-acetyl-D-mannosaminuronic acid transferase (WecB/TagA/CpsF family)
MAKKVRLLNVDVDDITLDELIDSFQEGLLLTVHVDMIVKLQKDRELYELLQQFSPITCDSQILVAAAKVLGTPLRGRAAGATKSTSTS